MGLYPVGVRWVEGVISGTQCTGCWVIFVLMGECYRCHLSCDKMYLKFVKHIYFISIWLLSAYGNSHIHISHIHKTNIHFKGDDSDGINAMRR